MPNVENYFYWLYSEESNKSPGNNDEMRHQRLEMIRFNRNDDVQFHSNSTSQAMHSGIE